MHDPCQSGKCLILLRMVPLCPVSGLSVNTYGGQSSGQAGHPRTRVYPVRVIWRRACCRPVYRFANVRGNQYFPGDDIDLFLPRTAIFGVAYVDSSFVLPVSPMVKLLASRRACRLFGRVQR